MQAGIFQGAIVLVRQPQLSNEQVLPITSAGKSLVMGCGLGLQTRHLAHGGWNVGST
jgi:hypothetical protein